MHCDLQVLYYDLSYMYTLTHKIKEGIEFQSEINVKLNPDFFLSL
jgi:hypothetical protein